MQEFLSSAAGTFLALFPIASPLTKVPIFYSLTAEDSSRYRDRQIRQTAINVVLVLATFLVAGKLILGFFQISLGVLRIAGGLIVAHTAWEMVLSRQRLTALEHQEAADKEDISFTPMAIPLISGPGAIGVTIGLSEGATAETIVGCLLGIGLLGVMTYLCLALGQSMTKSLGETGMGALNRVFGFFTLAIAVQLIASGTLAFIQQSAPGLLK